MRREVLEGTLTGNHFGGKARDIFKMGMSEMHVIG